MFAPFEDPEDDLLSQVCQLQVFFSLLSTIILKSKPDSQFMATMMPILLAVPPVCACIFESGLLEEIHKISRLPVCVWCSARLLGVMERCFGVKQAPAWTYEGGDGDKEESEKQPATAPAAALDAAPAADSISAPTIATPTDGDRELVI